MAPPQVDTGSSRSTSQVKSADRTLLLLEHLARVRIRQSATQIHQELGIPKSSLHGLLWTLVSRGWVEVDESGTLFGLGVRSLLVGTAFIDADTTVARFTHAVDAIAGATGETVHHGRLDGTDVVYLVTRQSVHGLRLFSRVGRRLPAHAAAIGKAILANHLNRFDELYPPGAELARLTPYTLTNRRELFQELEAVNARGFAIDREENTVGVNCFAMALPGGHSAQDAISVSVPMARLDPNREREIVGLLQEYVTDAS